MSSPSPTLPPRWLRRRASRTPGRGRSVGTGNAPRARSGGDLAPSGTRGWVELATGIGQFITALAAIGALVFTAQSLDQTAEATRATRDEIELSRQGQFTERFTKAVEQLGQEDVAGEPSRLSIRLGGIYALERLMHDSRRDQATIVEVLCAFVRTHAPAPPGESAVPPPDLASSPPDVKAAVTVLARRPTSDSDTTADGLIDFNGARLSLPGAFLYDADLAGADLRGANLSRATLWGAELSGRADLRWVNLSGANLRDVDFGGSDLRWANLSGARLWGTLLDQVDLRGADLTAAQLYDVDLTSTTVTTDQIRCAFVNHSTKLPNDVARPVEHAPENDPHCSGQASQPR